jgi:hypothetical protein
LWQANADGEARLRCSRSDYFVHDSPVVSTNGQKLAYYYWTCRASGDFRDIVVIDLKGVFSDQAVEAKVVFRTHRDINPKSIRWLGENMIEFIVQGRRIEIDTSGKGTEQLP